MKKYSVKKVLSPVTAVLKQLGSFFSYILFEFKEIELVKAFNEAGGLKGIVGAFWGKSAQELEIDAIYQKIKKEETARIRVREETLKELREKDK